MKTYKKVEIKFSVHEDGSHDVSITKTDSSTIYNDQITVKTVRRDDYKCAPYIEMELTMITYNSLYYDYTVEDVSKNQRLNNILGMAKCMAHVGLRDDTVQNLIRVNYHQISPETVDHYPYLGLTSVPTDNDYSVDPEIVSVFGKPLKDDKTCLKDETFNLGYGNKFHSHFFDENVI